MTTLTRIFLVAACAGLTPAFASTAAQPAWANTGGVRIGAGPPFYPARSSERVLYSFLGGSDGSNPWGDLLADRTGALYSTTQFGGVNGFGTVFRLAPRGKKYWESVLYSFAGGDDGASPWSGVIADRTGALYSTTGSGGNADAGTVFKLTGKIENILYGFKDHKDGGYPVGPLIADDAGTLYGTTVAGGAHGYGAVFRLNPVGRRYTETVLYSFDGRRDGQNPHGGLLADRTGALYGTTTAGGRYGAGTIFKLARLGAAYRLSFAYSLTGKNGAIPNAALIADKTGALYGTATWGGNGPCDYGFSPYQGCGTVFKLTPSAKGYTETTLYNFQGSDGAGPNANLIADRTGSLYTTTQYGGPSGSGAVVKLTPHGKRYRESVLWMFGGSGDGASPAAGLIADAKGALFGTTVYGGAYDEGTVFTVTP